MESKGVLTTIGIKRGVFIVETHPILFDQIPSMPQKGINTVTTFVTMN